MIRDKYGIRMTSARIMEVRERAHPGEAPQPSALAVGRGCAADVNKESNFLGRGDTCSWCGCTRKTHGQIRYLRSVK